jgi:hypothetical protein
MLGFGVQEIRETVDQTWKEIQRGAEERRKTQ